MAKSISILLVLSVLLSGCYSVKNAIILAAPYSGQIHWPKDYKPAAADFYIHNSIEISASPEVVWNLLVHAGNWPDWYEGMTNVEIIGPNVTTITKNTELKFSTMGQNFQGKIREFKPYERLAWETKNDKLGAYHAWLIIPTANGCMLITDEVQKGKLANLQKLFLPNKLRKLHGVWLSGFKLKAENITTKN